jgi:hypothetical protein
MAVALLFLLATALGSLSTLYWIPEEHLGRGYFQMNALVVLGLLALAATVAGLAPLAPFGEHAGAGAASLGLALLASFAYYAAIWRERWALGRWPLTAAVLASGAALLLAGRALPSVAALPHRTPLLVTALLSSALLLGWALVTMLLGHWYLIAPRLTFRHLVVFCWVLLALVVLRLAAFASSVGVALGVDPLAEPHPWRLLASLDGEGMFFWVRLLWGLAIPLLLAVLSLHCARQRSNQSATGILYVLVVGAFIGEITGFYLTAVTGVPV